MSKDEPRPATYEPPARGETPEEAAARRERNRVEQERYQSEALGGTSGSVLEDARRFVEWRARRGRPTS